LAEEWQYAELADTGPMVIKVEGLKELLKALKKFPEQSDQILAETMIHALAKPQSQARKTGYAPVDTGILRGSIGVEAKGGILEAQKVGSEIVGRLGSKVEYARYQEYGTQYMVGKYYLTRAVKDTAGEMVKIFEQQIAKVLKRLGL